MSSRASSNVSSWFNCKRYVDMGIADSGLIALLSAQLFREIEIPSYDVLKDRIRCFGAVVAISVYTAPVPLNRSCQAWWKMDVELRSTVDSFAA